MNEKAPKIAILFLGAVGAALVFATAFVLIFVIARTTADDRPVSVSAAWIFGFAFAVPLSQSMCLLGVVGALAGFYGARRATLGVALGSLVGGGLGVALVAGIGYSAPEIWFFAVGAVVQTLILTFVYRSVPSPSARKSSSP